MANPAEVQAFHGFFLSTRRPLKTGWNR
jgi:hypothetical protein